MTLSTILAIAIVIGKERARLKHLITVMYLETQQTTRGSVSAMVNLTTTAAQLLTVTTN